MRLAYRTELLHHNPETVFAWHKRSGALERLTPPWAVVDVLEKEGGIQEGATVSLRAGGKVGKSAMTHYMDISGQGFYFTVGDNYNAVHRDALFDLDIQEAGDRYNGMVAVDKPVSEAMALPLDEEIAAHLGLEDRADSYRITGLSPGAAGGDRVQIDIAFPNPEFRFHIEVYDETRGKRLKKITQLEGSASIKLPMAADKPGQIIRIVDANPGLYHLFSSYTLKVSGL